MFCSTCGFGDFVRKLSDFFMDYLCEISLWKGIKTKNYISVVVTLTLVLCL